MLQHCFEAYKFSISNGMLCNKCIKWSGYTCKSPFKNRKPKNLPSPFSELGTQVSVFPHEWQGPGVCSVTVMPTVRLSRRLEPEVWNVTFRSLAFLCKMQAHQRIVGMLTAPLLSFRVLLVVRCLFSQLLLLLFCMIAMQVYEFPLFPSAPFCPFSSFHYFTHY